MRYKDKLNHNFFFNLFVLTFFFLLFFTKFLISAEVQNKNDYFCENVDPSKFLNQKSPSHIIIETNNPRRWVTNLFTLHLKMNEKKYQTHNKEWFTFKIDENFKKKFKSKIKFVFNNPDYECISRGQISVRGDLWWHLDWQNGAAFSSLRVDLQNGHLNNLVKFNLLLPKSRNSPNGNIDLELFVTALFNKVGLLAPKSKIVKVKINGNERNYLFQEILSKEFLESRNLVEGPIFEGDQQYTVEQFSNNKWRGDLGLARMINSSYSTKNKANEALSLNSLSLLNNIFIDNATESDTTDYAKHMCVHQYLTINLDKYFNEKEVKKKHEIYESLIFATQTEHSLTCDDRKFYFEPILNYFLPIYNDGKSTLDINSTEVYSKIKKSDVTRNAVSGAEHSLSLLENINDQKFYKELLENGFSLKYDDYIKIKNKVLQNLNALRNLDVKDPYISIPNYFDDKDENYFGKEIKLVFKDFSKNSLEICDFKLKKCERHIVSNDDQVITKALLSQNFSRMHSSKYPFIESDKIYLFISTSKNYSDLTQIKKDKDQFVNHNFLDQFSISYNNMVETNINREKKILSFKFKDPTGRVKVQGNTVDSWSFEIDGEDFLKQNNASEINYLDNKLTGCVTFVDLKLINLSIKSNYSLCEDAYNFIRSSGNILSAEISNSFSDGLDFDFSSIKINNLKVFNAKNDCIDFSFGNYKILNSKIKNCGDKGISIGEKSNIEITNTNIENTNYGIAAKDSSKAVVTKSNISETKYCLAAYRKKQEFSGSIVFTDKINCINYVKVFEIDPHSRIFKNKKIVKYDPN